MTTAKNATYLIIIIIIIIVQYKHIHNPKKNVFLIQIFLKFNWEGRRLDKEE